MNRSIQLLLYLFVYFHLHAQIIIEKEGKKVPLENMILQVKQLDEFVSRFNYKTDFWGKPIDSDFQQQFPRDKYIGLLFNNQDSRTIPGSKDFSQDYINLKSEFISQVAQNPGKYINPLSDKIFAIAECKVLYKNKSAKARIILNRFIGENYVKWVIRKVEADFLNLKKDKAILNSMPPNSHETNFISLKKSFDKKLNLENIVYKQFEYNQLSVFLYLVSLGDINFQNVEKLEFVILDIQDWAITVSEYNRNSENSGWLIKDISKDTDKIIKELEY